MFDSILLYLGGIAALLGLVRVRRRSGRITAAAGVAAMVIALAWPASEKRATEKTKLDEIMPVWQFDERHEIAVAAPPAKVFEAIHAVTADEIFLFRALTAIRRGGRKGPESILNVPEKQPILDVATRTSFKLLADDAPHELVVGTIIERPDVTLATMNFRVLPNGNGSLITTETRVHARTAAAARRFAVYWRVIHPGSDIIRRTWLRAIKRRAES